MNDYDVIVVGGGFPDYCPRWLLERKEIISSS